MTTKQIGAAVRKALRTPFAFLFHPPAAILALTGRAEQTKQTQTT